MSQVSLYSKKGMESARREKNKDTGRGIGPQNEFHRLRGTRTLTGQKTAKRTNKQNYTPKETILVKENYSKKVSLHQH